MTIQDTKDSIKTKFVKDEQGNYFDATFSLSFRILIDGEPTPGQLKEMEELAKDQILRTLYEDRRKEMYEAMLEFCSVEPWNFGQLVQKREALFKAARFQPESEYKP